MITKLPNAPDRQDLNLRLLIAVVGLIVSIALWLKLIT